jgi:nitroreductase
MEVQTEFTARLIESRQTIRPKRLIEPGASEEQIKRLLLAAAAAPDHDQLTPWRFLIIPNDKRAALGDLFANALLERDESATFDQQSAARNKAFRSPFLMLLSVDEGQPPFEIDVHERVLSAGCAVQNILLLATAMGYGSSLTSGKALKSACLREGLGLRDTEHAICFLSIGTPESQRPPKSRPSVDQFVTTWDHHITGAAPNALSFKCTN